MRSLLLAASLLTAEGIYFHVTQGQQRAWAPCCGAGLFARAVARARQTQHLPTPFPPYLQAASSRRCLGRRSSWPRTPTPTLSLGARRAPLTLPCLWTCWTPAGSPRCPAKWRTRRARWPSTAPRAASTRCALAQTAQSGGGICRSLCVRRRRRRRRSPLPASPPLRLPLSETLRALPHRPPPPTPPLSVPARGPQARRGRERA